MTRPSPFVRVITTFTLFSVLLLGQSWSNQACGQQRVVKPNYAQAKQYSSKYLRQFVYSGSVTPKWIGKSDTFWYSYRTSLGTKYYLVDAKKATKEELFNHQKLAGLISVETRKPVDAHNISLRSMVVAEDGNSFTFRLGSTQYKYNLQKESLEKVVAKKPTSNKVTDPSKTKDGSKTDKKSDVKKNSTKQKSDDKKKVDSDKKKSEVKKVDKKKVQKKTSDQKKTGKKVETKKGESKDKTQKRGRRGRKNRMNRRKEVQKKQDKSKVKKTQKKDQQKVNTKAKQQAKPKTAAKAKPKKPDHRSFSPDRKSYVFAKGHDLYFVRIPKNYKPPVDKTKEKKTTEKPAKDGKQDKDQKKKEEKKTEKKEKETTSTSKKVDAKKDDGKESDKKKTLPIPKRDPKLDAKAIRLTTNGEEGFSFASSFFGRRRRSSRSSTAKIEKDTLTKPRVSWSEDSKSFHISRYDRRNVKKLFVINSLSDPRPTLEEYSYAMPGEEGIRVQHFYYFNAAKKKLVQVPTKWKHETFRNVHWNRSGDKLRFGRHDRLLRNVEFCELDVPSGEIKCLIKDGFEAAFYESRSARYLKKTDEMIWWSEKTGWGHYYLYDRDGNFKNAITAGPFRVSRIVDIDEKNRLVYFYANGREAGENIYYQHLYRVRMDGTGLTLMDPGNANHRSTLSPSKRFVVDNSSAVDQAPKAVLRDSLGNKIMDLESSDLSRLKQVGWKMPSTFVVKAADGVTNLYGNMWKPFDFNPKKRYPIIAHVYPGPQTEGTSHTFSATAGNQQLAQLGFIVIQVGHRGGTPQRSKAYASYGYYNLRDYGLADKKAAIEQLAQRFSFIDVKRVGIYGHSGGGFMTATALLLPPYNEFFTAGFSTAGNHDNNIYNNSWSERYHGLKIVKGSEKEKAQSTGSSRSIQRSRLEEILRQRRRRGAPETGFDFAAGDVTDSDFFYEHQGEIDPLSDGPDAFLNPQQKQDKSKVQKKEEGSKKGTETKSDQKKKSDGKGKTEKTRFEIKVPTTTELAENLKGHLFLVHGEADNNVHPANTLRLVDALIRNNKRFDMLYLPSVRHSFGRYRPYVSQRMYEFFAEHLLDDYQDDADLSVVK